MPADTPFLVNGADYDGTSWNLGLPSFMRVEKILRQARSINFDFKRTQVNHRLGRSPFSNGTNRGRVTPEPGTISMPWEAWEEIMPLLAAQAPDGRSVGLAEFDFSLTLKKANDAPGGTVEFFKSRWLGGQGQAQHDADGLFIDVEFRCQLIRWNGYNP
jgi:hypothetical protein